jgi:hypothetical protein
LLCAPHIRGVVGDISEIEFCQGRKPVLVHAVRLLVAPARFRIRARILPMTSPFATPLSMPA